MSETQKTDRGLVEIDAAECKGCGLCIEACVPHVLRLAETLNRYGYHPAIYEGHGCSGCGLCFFVCPEPGAIRVFKRVVPARPAAPEMALANA